MKTLASGDKPGLWIRRAQPREAPSRATSSATAVITLGSLLRSHDLVDRRPLSTDHHLPGRTAAAGDRQHVAKRLGKQHGISHKAVADELVELAAVAPGGLVQVVRGQEDRTGAETAGIAKCPDRFDCGGHAAFHVSGAAAGEQPVVSRRAAARTAGEPCRGGRRTEASGRASRCSCVSPRRGTRGIPPLVARTLNPSAV